MKTLRRSSMVLCLLAGGCATPSQFLVDHRQNAMDAALDHARINGPCPNPTGKFVSQEMAVPPVGRGDWIKNGVQANYRIRISGCPRELLYTVICTEGNASCVAADEKPDTGAHDQQQH